jgi:hypothetical protein
MCQRYAALVYMKQRQCRSWARCEDAADQRGLKQWLMNNVLCAFCAKLKAVLAMSLQSVALIAHARYGNCKERPYRGLALDKKHVTASIHHRLTDSSMV